MRDAQVVTVLKTPLHDVHLSLGARMMSFGGWEMPVQYSGITEEHLAVRRAAGMFDVSHMGEIEVAGTNAIEAIQWISTNDAARLKVGQTQYSALATPEGTFVDDLLVYRLAEQHFLLVVNAANIAKDMDWISNGIRDMGDVVAVNTSARYALVAVQGPLAFEVVQPLTDVDLASIRYFEFSNGEVANIRSTISRTGYTGEDGFEIFVSPQGARRLWTALSEQGTAVGLRPAGLGARDTLRLEGGMRLSGQDIDDTTSVLEAGLGGIVGWGKSDFVGRGALLAQREAGVRRRLVGFEVVERGIARRGYQVYVGSERVGVVTSGTRTPFLEKAIGLAYLSAPASAPGTKCDIDIRGRRVEARVVVLPFYKRPRG